jgi:hypothetical protein
MSTSAGDKIYNIHLSFNKAIADSLRDESGQLRSVPVNYDDDSFETKGLSRWVKLFWIDHNMEDKSEMLCQVSCVTRNDKQGFGLARLIYLVFDAFKNMNHSFTIYDFSNISIPQTTGRGASISFLRPGRDIPTTEAGVREFALTLRIYYGMHMY